MGNYPEHEKLRALAGRNHELSAFLDWLDDQGLQLCRFDPERGGRFEPHREPYERLLGRYFGVDTDELSREKDRMYQELVAANRTRSGQEG